MYHEILSVSKKLNFNDEHNPNMLSCNLSTDLYLLGIFYLGNPIVWKFLREEWPYLVDRFSLNDRYLGRIPKTIASGFSTKLELEELKAFFAKYPKAGAGGYSFI